MSADLLAWLECHLVYLLNFQYVQDISWLLEEGMPNKFGKVTLPNTLPTFAAIIQLYCYSLTCIISLID